MTDDPGHRAVHRPDRDQRVHDAARFLRDREAEAEAMIALWSRSTKPYAADELSHWRAGLARVRRELNRLRGDVHPGDQHDAEEQ
jgi:hypothetical protein